MAQERNYSKCGFDCSRCPAFKDNSRTEADRQRGSALWEKYFGLHFKPEMVRCEGCQAAAPWQTGNLLPDRSCPIRACAVYNAAATCAHCALFPCQEYAKRVPGPDLRQQRETAANIKISDQEYRDYLEPFDGQTHLMDLNVTLRLEEIVAPKSFSAGDRLTPFPVKVNLTSGKLKDLQLLHSLLSKAFSQTARNYVGQILLERDRLVLASSIWGARKECSRLVRKKDNTLFEPVQDVVEGLKQFGIQIEFQALKKNWILTLKIDEKAGGASLLESLKTYVSSLVKQYGEPVYVNGYNLKGQAFKAFTRVDMRSL